VNPVFDFAVVVANVGAEDATVKVSGQSVNQTVTVKAGSLEKVYLPWVDALKGPESGIAASVLARKGAFHVESDRPVVVYQFNPIEFEAKGGPPGKDWRACRPQPFAPGCYSYSNDASLLLPSTAMTGNYRIMGSAGWSRTSPNNVQMASYFVVTATQDGTDVTVKLSAAGQVVAGGGISAAPAGGTLTFSLNAGDVAEVVGAPGNRADFSGSLLAANKPVQVVTGVPCIDFPLNVQACDHVEEAVFPVETLGKRYVVTRPTGPVANNVGHVVRLFGNVDGTTLTYLPSKPANCPATLNAGQVADCGEVGVDFEVSGTNEFGVATFMIGGEKADPNFDPDGLAQPQGDPSQSFAVAVEQYRKKYVFLAPTDYKTNYVDVVAPANTTVNVDGQDVSSNLRPLNGTSYLIGRIKLGPGRNGAHVLESSNPVGIQVLGYGDNTTYQYPGGLNLGVIASVPIK
jgi:hypothetical protein